MEPFKVGDLCKKCGEGRLEFFYKPNDSRGGSIRTGADSWKCNYCNEIFTAFISLLMMKQLLAKLISWVSFSNVINI